MARIRTIKPSMWSDASFCALDLETRLVYVGLISFSDDEGRFIATPQAVLGFLFPLDDVSAKRWTHWKTQLQDAGMVSFYRVAGREYGFHPNWTKHQVINRKQASTLPAPPAAQAVPAPAHSVSDSRNESVSDSRNDSLDPRTTRSVGEGNGRERNGRGASDDAAPTAQTLIGEFIDGCRTRPPGNVIAQLGKHVAALLGEGFDPAAIRAALAKFRAKPMHPSVLPSLVNEVVNDRAVARIEPRTEPKAEWR